MNRQSTAIVPPRGPAMMIDRPTLLARLKEVDRSRVTTIIAPAGYGKTVAASMLGDALSRSGRPVMWIASRAGITSASDLVMNMNASAVASGLNCPAHIGVDPRAATNALCNHPNRPVLIIDAVETLPADAMDFVAKLVLAGRDEMTTILVSRSRKVIPVARLRSLGYLAEIGQEDLQFTIEEVQDLIGAMSKGSTDRRFAEQVLRETEGWPAGVAMAMHACNRDTGTPAARGFQLSGIRQQFESYFEEEVLGQLSSNVKNFLVSTIVLDELTPARCTYLIGDENSGHMLELVEEAGLFLRRENKEVITYRYHHLFRQTLLRQLNDREAERAAVLHRRASLMFAREGNALKAIEHARMCGDVDFLADQLDTHANELVYSGHLYIIDSLVGLLSKGVYQQRPYLALAIAWRRVRSLSYEAADVLINLAEEELHRRTENGSDIIENRKLERTIEHRRLMLAAARDDMKLIKDRAEVLLREFGDSEPYLSCTLLAQLMASRRELFHFQDMLRLEAEVQRALSRPGSDFASIALKASIAPTLAAQGKSSVAEMLLQQALEYALEVSGASVAAIPALPLAEILYDRGEHARAGELVNTYLCVAREWGFIDQLMSGFLVHARLKFNAGDFTGAIDVLEDMQRIAIDRDLDRLRAAAVSEQVKMLIQNGEVAEARYVFRASGLMPKDEPVPTLNPTRKQESIATSVIRLAVEEHRLGDARRLAKRWKDFVRMNGAMRSVVNFDLLLAEIAVRAGDRSDARRSIREAVSLAAGADWTQPILDEGASIRNLICEIYSGGLELDSAPDQFGRRLIKLFSAGTDWPADPEAEAGDEVGLTSKLVCRELDILRMVGGGLRNREIGDRLGLTEGTVKWYMQQIYDKLGVRRRPQAVNRARQLGVLT